MDGQTILRFLQYHPQSSRNEIAEGVNFTESDTTLKRLLSAQIAAGSIQVKATRYSLTSACHMMMPIDIDTYFLRDQDERQIQSTFIAADKLYTAIC